MIKYPNEKSNHEENKIVFNYCPTINSLSIKPYIQEELVSVGTKFVIDNKDITCIHREENQFFFQFDDCPIISSAAEEDSLKKALEEIWNDFIPETLKEDIEYLFIPTEFQVFGENKYGLSERDSEVYQFDYYKNNGSHCVKNYIGENNPFWDQHKTCEYWLDSIRTKNNYFRCSVSSNGIDNYLNPQSPAGVPVLFLIKV